MSENTKLEFKEQKQKDRSPKKTLIFIGLVFILVLSVVSFVFIPIIGTSYGTPEEPVFGKWGKTPIKWEPGNYFARQVEMYTRQWEQAQQKMTEQIRYQIWNQAYEVTVVRTGVQEELKRAGYIVPEEAINKILLNYYVDETGKFSQKVYQSVPESDRLAMRKLLKEELAVQTYAEDLCGTPEHRYGLKVSSKEIALIQKTGKTERSFYMAAFPIEDYPEEMVAAYGQENAGKFVRLNTSIVTANSQKEAETLRARITNNEITFEDAVSEYSTATRGNAEGKITQSYVYQYESFVSEDNIQSLLSLETSALSPVMAIGDNGEHGFFRINEAAVQPDFSQPEIIATVTAYMNVNDRGRIEDYYVSRARDFILIAEKDGFDAACGENDIEKIDVPFLTLNYGNSPLYTQLPSSTVKELIDVSRNEDFFVQAFSLKGTAISEPIVTNSNVLVLTLQEERPAVVVEGMETQYADFCSNAANSQLMANYIESPKHQNMFYEAYLKYLIAEN